MAKDFGLIATQSGVDISRAPDYKQVFNSKWPILEIMLEKIVDVIVEVPTSATNTSVNVIIATHNLGFAPAIWWDDSQGPNLFGPGYSTGGPPFYTYNILADKTNISININFILASDTPFSFPVKGMLKVFNYNPKTEFKATSGSAGDSPSPSDYGLEILKDPAIGNMADVEYSHFSLNTRAKAMNIHQSGVMNPDPDNNYGAKIIHNLGYLPSYIVFTPTGDALSVGIASRTYGTKNDLTFFGVQAILVGPFYYIVFKDPILEKS